MRRGWRNAGTWAGAIIVGIAAFCALFAPLLVPHDPFAQDLGKRLLVPFWMPGIVLAFTAIPALTRLTRSGMIEAMASDYIRTARAKGLSRARIVLKHALRNAAIPVVSIAAVQLGFMLGGSIVIETVFALHGVGYLGWESIAKNDFPVVQAVVLVLAVFYIGLTLLADILNALLDPRLRTG